MGVVSAIRQLVAAGFTMEQALVAAEIMEANTKSVDAQADRRRAKDRERKRLRNSAESAEKAETTLPSPDGPPPQTPPPLNPPSCPDQAPAAVEAAPRQAQPEAGQGRVDYDQVQSWVASLVGQHPVAINLDISPILALLRAGYSRERVEVGVRAAVGAAKQPIRSWKSFDGWVRNTAAEAKPVTTPPSQETVWKNKLDHWSKRGEWPGVWGDPPDHPCCSIPADFIAKHKAQIAA